MHPSSQPEFQLKDFAMLPGFVNIHSHAFQRGLRGFGESFPDGAGSFWTWREAMYSLVESLDADKIYDLSRQCFQEMLAAGITTVGEMHYVHHDATDLGFALDEAVIAAARDAGIRLAFLPTYYRTGGIDQPLRGGQKRFECLSPSEYWRQWDRLTALVDGQRVSLGAVAHSIRAAPIEDIQEIHEESRRRNLIFHIHVEEQIREVEDCQRKYGARPLALLNDRLKIDDRVTAIHCTHCAPEDLRQFLQSGGNIGLCPLTEGNLGDGFANVPLIRSAGGNLCFGTDSNARLCVQEELRWIEYVQRLCGQRRGVNLDGAGRCAAALLEIATRNGARALRSPAGSIQENQFADFILVDLQCPSMRGWTPTTLLDTFLFGCDASAIAATCVGGAWSHGSSVRRPGLLM